MCAQRAVGVERVRVRHAVDTACADLPADTVVLVACSGGPDSLALTDAAVWVGVRRSWQVRAVIVDHGLQRASAQVAADAAQACADLGAQASVCRVEVGTDGGPEAAARAARYAALRAHAQSSGAGAVLLGHTRDDQAETVLLRLTRGSGARSLAAMARHDGLWRRPLLDLPRGLVHAAAVEALRPYDRQPWADPHNDDERFARVRVRRALTVMSSALGSSVIDGLVRSADALRDDADALDMQAAHAHAAALGPDGTLDAHALAMLPRAIVTRVIRTWLLAAGCPGADLDRIHVLAVTDLVDHWHGQGPISVPGGVCASRAYGRLRINGRQSPGG